MVNKYWAESFYPLFLSSVSSCTYSKMADLDLQNEIDTLALRAVAKFKFPKCSLAYEYDETVDGGVEKGYYFTGEDVTHKELLVILQWMKAYWLEYQLGKEKHYENEYVDKDVKAFSGGSLVSSIERAYKLALTFARKTEEDYYRVNRDGRPAIGDINGDEV